MKKIFIILFLVYSCFHTISFSSFANDKISSSSINDEVEIQSGIIGKWYKCGNEFSIKILYQPIMTKSQSYQTAVGMFILFRVLISNDSEYTYKGLKNESFTLSKDMKGMYKSFPLSGGHSRNTSKAWELATLQDELGRLTQKDTFLVFDVEGRSDDNWILTFAPIERKQEDSICKIKITLPDISYK